MGKPVLCKEGGGRAFAGDAKGAEQAGFAGNGTCYPECGRGEELGPSPLCALSLLYHRRGLRLEGDTHP